MKQLEEELILSLIPSVRMILSAGVLKSGSFVPLDQLVVKDPREISSRIGRELTIIGGDPQRMGEEVRKKRKEIGEYLFFEQLGLLGLSGNHAKITQKLAAVRVRSRGKKLPESVAVPQIKSFLFNKVVVITGGSMGFGEGIARHLFAEGANVVIYDINEAAGNSLVEELNGKKTTNRAMFLQVDVTDPVSIHQAVLETVLEFSAIDVLVSNAGVLKAGAIDELHRESFDFVTKVNYYGYFHCVQAIAPVMKAQNRVSGSAYCDIIQINSKSGLAGSNRNSAYAGSKFAGIGFTQSLALELAPERIKVNAICPGNFFEGPLWSDPENGLLVQYLRAGKVPGARTIGEVKKHYESMVPMGRGCRVEDVVRAIRYVIEQEYETGQAIPVTGGQEMLG